MERSCRLSKSFTGNLDGWRLTDAGLRRFFDIAYNLGDKLDWDKINFIDVCYMFWHLQYSVVAGVGFGLSATNVAEVVGNFVDNKYFATSGLGVYLKAVLFAVAFSGNALLQLTFYNPLWKTEYCGKKNIYLSLLNGLLTLAVTPLFFPVATLFVYQIDKYLTAISTSVSVQKILAYYLIQFRAGMFANMLVLGSINNLFEVIGHIKNCKLQLADLAPGDADFKKTKEKMIGISIGWVAAMFTGLGLTYVMSIGPGKGLQGRACDALDNTTNDGVMQAMFFNDTRINNFMVNTLCTDNLFMSFVSYLAYHRFAVGMAKNLINGCIRSWRDFGKFLLKWSFLPLTTGALIVSDVVGGVNKFSLMATVVGGLFINEAGARNLVFISWLAGDAIVRKLRHQDAQNFQYTVHNFGSFTKGFIGLLIITLGAALPMLSLAVILGAAVYGIGTLCVGCCNAAKRESPASLEGPLVDVAAVGNGDAAGALGFLGYDYNAEYKREDDTRVVRLS
jgi:hypothetical protein